MKTKQLKDFDFTFDVDYPNVHEFGVIVDNDGDPDEVYLIKNDQCVEITEFSEKVKQRLESSAMAWYWKQIEIDNEYQAEIGVLHVPKFRYLKTIGGAI